MSQTTIGLLVYRGANGNDSKPTRHTSIFFQTDTTTGTVVHATGPVRNFRVEILQGYNPLTSSTLAGRVIVGATPQCLDTLQALVAQVPVNNDLDDWNCQNWVGEALQRLVENKVISAGQKSVALDGMVDLLLEGRDDQPF
ncbi:hypothetical protein RJZ56_007995 [Blastomyces dermatitidis]